MRCIVDNDACAKLATWSLLDSVLDMLGTSAEECEVHPNCRLVLMSKRFPEGAAARIEAFLDAARICSSAPSAAHLAGMDDVMQIDAGEAVLFGVAADDNTCLLTTGDKRALRALVRNSSCDPVREALNGRVYCVEQLVRQSIDFLTIEEVRSRVAPFSMIDGAMRTAFAEGASDEDLLAELERFVQKLRDQTGTLLAS